MSNRTLYLVRGLPGSGKSTLAKKLASHHFEADMYHIREDGVYDFKAENVTAAHTWCQDQVYAAMEEGADSIVVSNTFTRLYELEYYQAIAYEWSYTVFVIVCQNDFGNIHEVPESVLIDMAERWEEWL